MIYFIFLNLLYPILAKLKINKLSVISHDQINLINYNVMNNSNERIHIYPLNNNIFKNKSLIKFQSLRYNGLRIVRTIQELEQSIKKTLEEGGIIKCKCSFDISFSSNPDIIINLEDFAGGLNSGSINIHINWVIGGVISYRTGQFYIIRFLYEEGIRWVIAQWLYSKNNRNIKKSILFGKLRKQSATIKKTSKINTNSLKKQKSIINQEIIKGYQDNLLKNTTKKLSPVKYILDTLEECLCSYEDLLLKELQVNPKYKNFQISPSSLLFSLVRPISSNPKIYSISLDHINTAIKIKNILPLNTKKVDILPYCLAFNFPAHERGFIECDSDYEFFSILKHSGGIITISGEKLDCFVVKIEKLLCPESCIFLRPDNNILIQINIIEKLQSNTLDYDIQDLLLSSHLNENNSNNLKQYNRNLSTKLINTVNKSDLIINPNQKFKSDLSSITLIKKPLIKLYTNKILSSFDSIEIPSITLGTTINILQNLEFNDIKSLNILNNLTGDISIPKTEGGYHPSFNGNLTVLAVSYENLIIYLISKPSSIVTFKYSIISNIKESDLQIISNIGTSNINYSGCYSCNYNLKNEETSNNITTNSEGKIYINNFNRLKNTKLISCPCKSDLVFNSLSSAAKELFPLNKVLNWDSSILHNIYSDENIVLNVFSRDIHPLPFKIDKKGTGIFSMRLSGSGIVFTIDDIEWKDSLNFFGDHITLYESLNQVKFYPFADGIIKLNICLNNNITNIKFSDPTELNIRNDIAINVNNSLNATYTNIDTNTTSIPTQIGYITPIINPTTINTVNIRDINTVLSNNSLLKDGFNTDKSKQIIGNLQGGAWGIFKPEFLPSRQLLRIFSTSKYIPLNEYRNIVQLSNKNYRNACITESNIKSTELKTSLKMKTILKCGLRRLSIKKSSHLRCKRFNICNSYNKRNLIFKTKRNLNNYISFESYVDQEYLDLLHRHNNIITWNVNTSRIKIFKAPLIKNISEHIIYNHISTLYDSTCETKELSFVVLPKKIDFHFINSNNPLTFDTGTIIFNTDIKLTPTLSEIQLTKLNLSYSIELFHKKNLVSTCHCIQPKHFKAVFDAIKQVKYYKIINKTIYTIQVSLVKGYCNNNINQILNIKEIIWNCSKTLNGLVIAKNSQDFIIERQEAVKLYFQCYNFQPIREIANILYDCFYIDNEYFMDIAIEGGLLLKRNKFSEDNDSENDEVLVNSISNLSFEERLTIIFFTIEEYIKISWRVSSTYTVNEWNSVTLPVKKLQKVHSVIATEDVVLIDEKLVRRPVPKAMIWDSFYGEHEYNKSSRDQFVVQFSFLRSSNVDVVKVYSEPNITRKFKFMVKTQSPCGKVLSIFKIPDGYNISNGKLWNEQTEIDSRFYQKYVYSNIGKELLYTLLEESQRNIGVEITVSESCQEIVPIEATIELTKDTDYVDLFQYSVSLSHLPDGADVCLDKISSASLEGLSDWFRDFAIATVQDTKFMAEFFKFTEYGIFFTQLVFDSKNNNRLQNEDSRYTSNNAFFIENISPNMQTKAKPILASKYSSNDNFCYRAKESKLHLIKEHIVTQIVLTIIFKLQSTGPWTILSFDNLRIILYSNYLKLETNKTKKIIKTRKLISSGQQYIGWHRLTFTSKSNYISISIDGENILQNHFYYHKETVPTSIGDKNVLFFAALFLIDRKGYILRSTDISAISKVDNTNLDGFELLDFATQDQSYIPKIILRDRPTREERSDLDSYIHHAVSTIDQMLSELKQYSKTKFSTGIYLPISCKKKSLNTENLKFYKSILQSNSDNIKKYLDELIQCPLPGHINDSQNIWQWIKNSFHYHKPLYTKFSPNNYKNIIKADGNVFHNVTDSVFQKKNLIIEPQKSSESLKNIAFVLKTVPKKQKPSNLLSIKNKARRLNFNNKKRNLGRNITPSNPETHSTVWTNDDLKNLILPIPDLTSNKSSNGDLYKITPNLDIPKTISNTEHNMINQLLNTSTRIPLVAFQNEDLSKVEVKYQTLGISENQFKIPNKSVSYISKDLDLINIASMQRTIIKPYSLSWTEEYNFRINDVPPPVLHLTTNIHNTKAVMTLIRKKSRCNNIISNTFNIINKLTIKNGVVKYTRETKFIIQLGIRASLSEMSSYLVGPIALTFDNISDSILPDGDYGIGTNVDGISIAWNTSEICSDSLRVRISGNLASVLSIETPKVLFSNCGSDKCSSFVSFKTLEALLSKLKLYPSNTGLIKVDIIIEAAGDRKIVQSKTIYIFSYMLSNRYVLRCADQINFRNHDIIGYLKPGCLEINNIYKKEYDLFCKENYVPLPYIISPQEGLPGDFIFTELRTEKGSLVIDNTTHLLAVINPDDEDNIQRLLTENNDIEEKVFCRSINSDIHPIKDSISKFAQILIKSNSYRSFYNSDNIRTKYNKYKHEFCYNSLTKKDKLNKKIRKLIDSGVLNSKLESRVIVYNSHLKFINVDFKKSIESFKLLSLDSENSCKANKLIVKGIVTQLKNYFIDSRSNQEWIIPPPDPKPVSCSIEIFCN